jgi:hypothetical protein
MKLCNKLSALPAVTTDWQQALWCPDCQYYDRGVCNYPARADGNALCPWDGKELPLREVSVDPQENPEPKALGVGVCTQQESPDRSARLEQAVKDRIRQKTGGRVEVRKVEVSEGVVVVHGCAPCYYLKQLALQGVLDVLGSCGATRIELYVEVVDNPVPSGAGG